MTESGHTERLEAALAGRYRIERKLGEGGMASVYLAEDLKHERKVALKILRPELAAVIGAERFLSEIKTTANLQHPHILPLFDSGSADGYLYYVMPYIDGETLREKLDREKQLGIEESVQIARDVADALDYAHRHGVIHRDIKPGNILLHDGRPVVADFGIALAVSAAGGGRMTETGLSLGTPHYMSPEQASADRDLSARSDVYSLGCVLYEMIAGQPPHTGPSAQSILVHILTEEPRPLTSLRHTVPPNVAAAVTKSIEKLPADRFESAKQFKDALGDEAFTFQLKRPTAATGLAAAPSGSGPSSSWLGDRRSAAAVVVAVAMTIVAALGWLRPSPTPVVPEVARFSIPVPDSIALHVLGAAPDLAISPDGRRIVHQSLGSGGFQFNVRSLEQLGSERLRGGDDASGPFFSSDGAWVGFADRAIGTNLSKVSILGGPPVPLATFASQVRGADWGTDDRIVVGTEDGGLAWVPGGGGQAEILTTPDDGSRHEWPSLIESRGAVVFAIIPNTGPALTDGELAVLELGSGEITRLGLAGTSPKYVSPGYLVYAVADGSLRAVAFDPESLSVTGAPVPVVEGVGIKGSGAANFDISDEGTLVYAEGSGSVGANRQLGLVDLEGNRRMLPLAPRTFNPPGPGWSPDGRSIAFASEEQVYTYDVVLNTTPRQITFEGQNISPVFSPDGSQLAFSSQRDGTDGFDLFVKDLNQASPPRLLARLEGNQRPSQWVGALIVFESYPPGQTSSDLWILDLSDPANPEPRSYLTSEATLADVAVSPDGTLAAYRSTETGVSEIYVRTFPDAGERTLISQGGGAVPVWSPDGSTLYYHNGSGNPIMAVRIARDPVPVVVSVQSLFPDMASTRPSPLALHPDGDRFIETFAVEDGDSTEEVAAPGRLVLVQNFQEELKRLVGN